MIVALAALVGLATGWLARPLIVRETGTAVPALLPSVLTGLLFAAVAWRFGASWVVPAYLFFAALSVPLAVIDVLTKRLPNRLTLPAYPVVAALLLLPAAVDGDWSALGRAALGGAALLALFAVLHLINPAGMGLGDVKLSGTMGAMLGWLSWTAVLVGAFVGFVLGALVGLALMAVGRAGRKTALAFGPFMLIGAWAAILAGLR
jgi:leader peptidase (prepilin peptidase) / N-methyltransferase